MNRVIHFEIQADKVDRAMEFYGKVFGWKIAKMMSKDQGGMDYWSVATGESGAGINGGMYQRPMKDEEKFYRYDCTISVADLDAAIKAVKDAGGMIRREKMEIKEVGWFASAEDTEGNRFNLMQPTGWQPM